jgi:deazaflavin-dependent oxidoreductase (nitroreductase family)
MSSDVSPIRDHGTPTTTGPKPIGKNQRATNALMKVLLRTPLVSLGIGSKLLTVTVVGRKSGKTYVIPVAYTRHEGKLLVGTRKWPWMRNLRDGEPVELRVRGRRKLADHRLRDAEDEVVALYDVIARDNRVNASFAGIGIGADGTPNQADLHQAWQKGVVVLEFTER